MDETVMHRTVVAIGASAGGVEALVELVAKFPADLPAAVCITVHVSPLTRSALPAILNRSGSLPAAHATDAEPIQPSRIYVAPPDRHLLVTPGRLRITRGPRENGHRPSIDAMFRSASHAYGPQVVAVVLSGILDDGAAGARIVRGRGGLVVVQKDAAFPDMPRHAAAEAGADFDVGVDEIADVICDALGEQLPDAGFVPREYHFVDAPYQADDVKGVPTALTCPACGGVLNERDDSTPGGFRCQVGHAYSEESLLASQTESLEASLWAALRALEERAALLERLAHRFNVRGVPDRSIRFAEDADAAHRRAHVVRQALLDDTLVGGEAPVIADEEPSYDVLDEGST